jgi:Tfp pilus assembly protein PilO
MNLERTAHLLQRSRFVQLMLLFILLNVLVFVFLGLPARTRISRLQAEDAGLQSKILMQQREITNLQKRLAALEQAKKDLDQMYTQVLSPKKTGVTDIRLELEDLAQRLQIRKRDFSYVYSKIPDLGLLQFTLGVPVEGNYRNIRRFINEIERSHHFLILDRVVLSSEQTGEQLNLDFRLSTYLTDEKKAGI